MDNNNVILGEGSLLGNLAKKLKLIIKDKSITTDKLADNAVTKEKIAVRSITPDMLSDETKQMIAKGGKGVTPFTIEYNVPNVDIIQKPISLYTFGSAVVVLKKKAGYNIPTDADITVTGARKDSYTVDGSYGILNISYPTSTVTVATAVNSYTISYTLNNVSFNTTPSEVTKGATKSFVITANTYYKVPDAITITGVPSSDYTYTKVNNSSATLEIRNVQSNVAIFCVGSIMNTNYYGVSNASSVAGIKASLSDLTDAGNTTISGTKTFTITSAKPRMWFISSKTLTFKVSSIAYEMNHVESDGMHYYYSDELSAGNIEVEIS